MKSQIAFVALLIIFNCGGSIALTAEQACDNFGHLHQTFEESPEGTLKSYQAKIGEFPHSVALAYAGKKHDTSYNCNGVLISEKFVLTPHTCTQPKPLAVRLGKTSQSPVDNQEPLDVKVKKITKHPDFNSRSGLNNIALIELEEAVTLSPKVWPACLNRDLSDAKKELISSGWGTANIDGEAIPRSDWLLKVKLEEMDLETCRNIYRNITYTHKVTESHICAQDPISHNDICTGSSGSFLGTVINTPATSDLPTPSTRYMLHGLTVSGVGCGSQYPSLFTRVASNIHWIEKNVWP